MKYFDSLPKTSFQSSIGQYDISDFFTYIDWSTLNEDIFSVENDEHTTLIEAAYKLYQDPDSFWTFLMSNNNYNPFLISQVNIPNFKEQEKTKLNVSVTNTPSGATGIAFPKGSIILNYTSNTGASSSFSSVGNFDLNGGFVLVDSPFYYQQNMVVKDYKVSPVFQQGVTGNQTVVLYPDSNGTYQIQKLLYTKSSNSALVRQTLIVDSISNKVLSDEITTRSSGGRGDSILTEPISLGGGSAGIISPDETIYTVEDVADSLNTTIKAYSNQFIGTLKSSFITAKYI
jgi:hypothetical protein